MNAGYIAGEPCWRPHWYQFDCTGIGLDYIPDFPPYYTSSIVFTGNNLKVVNDTFAALNNLKYLWLNKNGLEIFYLSNISDMSKLVFLDLSDNYLHTASFHTDFKIPSLRSLAIQNNLYDTYPETFILSMASLQNLKIDLIERFGSAFCQWEN